MNVRALQEVMDAQTLAYVFPYSQFSFPTDISCIILAEGRKSAFFETELNVPLRAPRGPAGVAALYKPANQVKSPSPEKLAAFRDLVVGARCGKVQVPDATSEVRLKLSQWFHSDWITESQTIHSTSRHSLSVKDRTTGA